MLQISEIDEREWSLKAQIKLKNLFGAYCLVSSLFLN